MMDPLSDVLQLLKPKSYMSGGFDLGGSWSVGFDAHEGVKCYTLVSGWYWLVMDGVEEPVRMEAGDCFVLPRGRAFRLTNDLGMEPVNFKDVVQAPPNGLVRTYQGGGTFSVGGYFSFEGKHAEMLLGVLPSIVHIRKEADREAMRWALDRMSRELREPQPGGTLVAQQLAYLMLVQALRLYMAEGVKGGVGWLFALADKQMGEAISAMHGEPGRRWTLQELAERVGMSRSVFALRFKETVGKSPMEYLTEWRMLRAGDRLVNSADSVGEIALGLGYESESAFSTAFKRVMGCSPRRYSRGGSDVAAWEGELVGI